MPRHHIDGRPYYCKTCGLGYGEWAACEEVDCELESTEDAQDRVRAGKAMIDYVKNGGTSLEDLRKELEK